MTFPLFYPLEVLSTNRILESPLVKQKPGQFQLVPQLTELYRAGFTNLFRGFFPSILASAARNAPALFVISNGVMKPDTFVGASLFWTAFGTFIANPLEILTARYQNADFKRASVVSDMTKIWKENPANIWRVGLSHAIARNLTIALVVASRPPQDFDSPFATALIAATLSHPFEYLRVRQMWGEEGKQVGESTLKALQQVSAEKGVQELYRGFGARALIFLVYAESIAYAIRNRDKKLQ